MKRVSWAATLALLFSIGVPPSAAAQWSLGVALGGTYGNAGGEAVGSSSYRWGGTVGANFAYMTRSYVVRVEGNFVGKGADKVVPIGSDSAWLNYSFNYVEVPLLVGPLLHLGEDWIWEFFAGLQVAFSTSCKATLGNSGSGASDCAFDLPGGRKESMVFSVPFGTSLDYQIPASRTKFVFDFRYYLGLSDALQDASLKTSGFQFLLRLQFGG